MRLYLAAAHALKLLWAWERNILYNFCTKSLLLLWKLSLFEWLRNYGGIKDPPKNIEETARGTILKVTLKSYWVEFLQKKKDKPQICFFTNLCWRASPKSMQNATKPFVFEGQSLKTFNLREKEVTFFFGPRCALQNKCTHVLRRALKVDATFQIQMCTRASLKNCFDRTDPHLNALISRGVRAHIFKSARSLPYTFHAWNVIY